MLDHLSAITFLLSESIGLEREPQSAKPSPPLDPAGFLRR